MLQNFDLVRERIASEKARLEKKAAQIAGKLLLLEQDLERVNEEERLAKQRLEEQQRMLLEKQQARA